MKYPLWYKIVVYSLYAVMALTIVFWGQAVAEKNYWIQISEQN